MTTPLSTLSLELCATCFNPSWLRLPMVWRVSLARRLTTVRSTISQLRVHAMVCILLATKWILFIWCLQSRRECVLKMQSQCSPNCRRDPFMCSVFSIVVRLFFFLL